MGRTGEYSLERRRWLRRRGKAHLKRRADKNLLVGHIREKIVRVEKVHPRQEPAEKATQNCRYQNEEG